MSSFDVSFTIHYAGDEQTHFVGRGIVHYLSYFPLQSFLRSYILMAKRAVERLSCGTE